MKQHIHRHIALFLGEELGIPNQARTGIIQYARPNHHWRFSHLSRRMKDLIKVRDMGWDGIIANFTDARKIARVKRFGIPVVNIYGGRVSWGVPQAGVDNQAIGEMAADYFLRKKSPNLAFYGIAGSGYSIGRWVGFRDTAISHGYRPVRFVYRNLTESEKGIPKESHLTRWVSSLPKPVGILTCDALRGIWLTEVCRSLGIAIPGEVSIVCAGGDELTCQSAFPPLSSIPLPEEKCGYLAAEMLDHIFNGRRFKRQVLLAPGPVVERMSSDIHHVRDPVVVKALAYIRENAFRGLKVDDLAPHTGVCRRALERKFRRLLSLSPHEQIHNVQIEEAKRLLSMTDATLEKIARNTGLGSGIQLSNKFKKHTGQTPGQYRKQFRLL